MNEEIYLQYIRNKQLSKYNWTSKINQRKRYMYTNYLFLNPIINAIHPFIPKGMRMKRTNTFSLLQQDYKTYGTFDYLCCLSYDSPWKIYVAMLFESKLMLCSLNNINYWWQTVLRYWRILDNQTPLWILPYVLAVVMT